MKPKANHPIMQRAKHARSIDGETDRVRQQIRFLIISHVDASRRLEPMVRRDPSNEIPFRAWDYHRRASRSYRKLFRLFDDPKLRGAILRVFDPKVSYRRHVGALRSVGVDIDYLSPGKLPYVQPGVGGDGTYDSPFGSGNPPDLPIITINPPSPPTAPRR